MFKSHPCPRTECCLNAGELGAGTSALDGDLASPCRSPPGKEGVLQEPAGRRQAMAGAREVGGPGRHGAQAGGAVEGAALLSGSSGPPHIHGVTPEALSVGCHHQGPSSPTAPLGLLVAAGSPCPWLCHAEASAGHSLCPGQGPSAGCHSPWPRHRQQAPRHASTPPCWVTAGRLRSGLHTARCPGRRRAVFDGSGSLGLPPVLWAEMLEMQAPPGHRAV